MSWDPTCLSLIGTESPLDAISIADHSGVIYGCSHRDKFAPTQAEVEATVKVIKSGDSSITRYTLCGNPYFILRRPDGNVVVGKQGKITTICALTPKLILMGMCDETTANNSGNAVNRIYNLQEYYSNAGY